MNCAALNGGARQLEGRCCNDKCLAGACEGARGALEPANHRSERIRKPQSWRIRCLRACGIEITSPREEIAFAKPDEIRIERVSGA